MRIFLSYASQDRAAIEPVQLALGADARHEVFVDRKSLPAGEAYDGRIRDAIRAADLVIVFISPDAVDAGSYTLSEMAIAQEAFPNPSGRVLPVMLRETPIAALPAYLRAVTVLRVTGNLTADVVDAVERIAQARRNAGRRRIATIAALVVAALAAAGLLWHQRASWFGAGSTVTGKDGAPAVLIPAGAFVFGDDEYAPRREVFLDAYYIDTYEVTVGRYAKFLAATGNAHPPEGWPDDPAKAANLPVVGVDWNDANAYCKWAGRRLPTENEWEKAARGGDERRYPWGDGEPNATLAASMKTAEDAYAGGLDAVGSHPNGASKAGVNDLAGNASEWTADWYAERFPSADLRNPKGPESGDKRVIRGGGWQDAGDRLLVTRRSYASPDTRAPDIGFRCARDG